MSDCYYSSALQQKIVSSIIGNNYIEYNYNEIVKVNVFTNLIRAAKPGNGHHNQNIAITKPGGGHHKNSILQNLVIIITIKTTKLEAQTGNGHHNQNS